MSESQKPSSVPASAKRRSPVERLCVWGGILVLLALVGIEFVSRRAHEQTIGDLLAKVAGAELSGADVKLSDVREAVGNMSPRVEDVVAKNLANGGKRLEVYRWFSLNPFKKREMFVYYGIGDDPDVLSVSTDEDTQTIESVFPSPSAEQMDELKKRAAGASQAEATAPAEGDSADNAEAADKAENE